MDDDFSDQINKVEILYKHCQDDLTDWERNFISDLSDKIIQYEERTMFSDRQSDTVQRIWDKIQKKTEKKVESPTFQSDELPI